MNRLIIVARLREGAHDEAETLIAKGPPFDPEEVGVHHHAVYLNRREAVFLFEAPEVEWIVNDIVADPALIKAFDPWRELLDSPPRIAHERFYWSRGQGQLGADLGT